MGLAYSLLCVHCLALSIVLGRCSINDFREKSSKVIKWTGHRRCSSFLSFFEMLVPIGLDVMISILVTLEK